MVNETIEERVVIKNFLELSNPELINKWVNINGKDEFVILSEITYFIDTLHIEEDYVVKNHYEGFLASLKPVYIEKFFKETGKGIEWLKMIKPKENN